MLRVPGATLFYRMPGSGPLLLILPGGDADADTTVPFCEHVEDRHTVVAYDREACRGAPSTLPPRT
jgi:hypothetical protein